MELSLQENEEIEVELEGTQDYPVSELNQIREKIETMSKFNQIEILRILHGYNSDVTLNENKYGVHINLSEVKPEIIHKLKQYISYVNTQEITLNQVEKQKENFKNTYFAKDIKETGIKK